MTKKKTKQLTVLKQQEYPVDLTRNGFNSAGEPRFIDAPPVEEFDDEFKKAICWYDLPKIKWENKSRNFQGSPRHLQDYCRSINSLACSSKLLYQYVTRLEVFVPCNGKKVKVPSTIINKYDHDGRSNGEVSWTYNYSDVEKQNKYKRFFVPNKQGVSIVSAGCSIFGDHHGTGKIQTAISPFRKTCDCYAQQLFRLSLKVSRDSALDKDNKIRSGDMYFDFDTDAKLPTRGDVELRAKEELEDTEASKKEIKSLADKIMAEAVAEQTLDAWNDAKKCLYFLRAILNPSVIHVYLSGAKGIHIIVRNELVGEDLHLYFKWLALTIKEKLGLNTMDTGIYDESRLLRIPNTVNTKTGLYKVQITHNDLLNGEPSEVWKKATNHKAPLWTWFEHEPLSADAQKEINQRMSEYLDSNGNVGIDQYRISLYREVGKKYKRVYAYNNNFGTCSPLWSSLNRWYGINKPEAWPEDNTYKSLQLLQACMIIFNNEGLEEVLSGKSEKSKSSNRKNKRTDILVNPNVREAWMNRDFEELRSLLNVPFSEFYSFTEAIDAINAFPMGTLLGSNPSNMTCVFPEDHKNEDLHHSAFITEPQYEDGKLVRGNRYHCRKEGCRGYSQSVNDKEYFYNNVDLWMKKHDTDFVTAVQELSYALNIKLNEGFKKQHVEADPSLQYNVHTKVRQMMQFWEVLWSRYPLFRTFDGITRCVAEHIDSAGRKENEKNDHFYRALSARYLVSKTGASQKTVVRALAVLTAIGFLERTCALRNGDTLIKSGINNNEKGKRKVASQGDRKNFAQYGRVTYNYHFPQYPNFELIEEGARRFQNSGYSVSKMTLQRVQEITGDLYEDDVFSRVFQQERAYHENHQSLSYLVESRIHRLEEQIKRRTVCCDPETGEISAADSDTLNAICTMEGHPETFVTERDKEMILISCTQKWNILREETSSGNDIFFQAESSGNQLKEIRLEDRSILGGIDGIDSYSTETANTLSTDIDLVNSFATDGSLSGFTNSSEEGASMNDTIFETGAMLPKCDDVFVNSDVSREMMKEFQTQLNQQLTCRPNNFVEEPLHTQADEEASTADVKVADSESSVSASETQSSFSGESYLSFKNRINEKLKATGISPAVAARIAESSARFNHPQQPKEETVGAPTPVQVKEEGLTVGSAISTHESRDGRQKTHDELMSSLMSGVREIFLMTGADSHNGSDDLSQIQTSDTSSNNDPINKCHVIDTEDAYYRVETEEGLIAVSEDGIILNRDGSRPSLEFGLGEKESCPSSTEEQLERTVPIAPTPRPIVRTLAEGMNDPDFAAIMKSIYEKAQWGKQSSTKFVGPSVTYVDASERQLNP